MCQRTNEQPPQDGSELSDEELDFVVGGREIWFSQAMDLDTVLASLAARESTNSGPSSSG